MIIKRNQVATFASCCKKNLDKVNPRRTLTAEEQKRLSKLEGIFHTLKRGKNVQNRQLQTWLSADEYSQIEAEWDTQMDLREKLSVREK